MDPFAEFSRSSSVGDMLEGLERQIHYRQPILSGRVRQRNHEGIDRFPVARKLKEQREAKRFGK